MVSLWSNFFFLKKFCDPSDFVGFFCFVFFLRARVIFFSRECYLAKATHRKFRASVGPLDFGRRIETRALGNLIASTPTHTHTLTHTHTHTHTHRERERERERETVSGLLYGHLFLHFSHQTRISETFGWRHRHHHHHHDRLRHRHWSTRRRPIGASYVWDAHSFCSPRNSLFFWIK